TDVLEHLWAHDDDLAVVRLLLTPYFALLGGDTTAPDCALHSAPSCALPAQTATPCGPCWRWRLNHSGVRARCPALVQAIAGMNPPTYASTPFFTHCDAPWIVSTRI